MTEKKLVSEEVLRWKSYHYRVYVELLLRQIFQCKTILFRFSLSKSHTGEEDPMCSLSPILCAGVSTSSLNLHIFKKKYSTFFSLSSCMSITQKGKHVR